MFALIDELFRGQFFFSGDRSSTGRPDWTCIVVGFTSGYVRFYTEVSSCSAVSGHQALGPPVTQPHHARSTRDSSPAAWAHVVDTLLGWRLRQGRVVVESSGRSCREEKLYSEQRVPGVRGKLAVTVMPGPTCPGVSGRKQQGPPCAFS